MKYTISRHSQVTKDILVIEHVRRIGTFSVSICQRLEEAEVFNDPDAFESIVEIFTSEQQTFRQIYYPDIEGLVDL